MLVLEDSTRGEFLVYGYKAQCSAEIGCTVHTSRLWQKHSTTMPPNTKSSHEYIMTSHAWQVSPQQAVQIQKELRLEIRLKPLKKPIELVAGADISFNKFSPTVYAGIVLLRYPSMQEVGHSLVITSSEFPYIPGLLSFREIPALLEAWQQLRQKIPYQPDVILLDGHGIAHPRGLGIASHFGLVADVPTIGCAKKVLVGHFQMPESQVGASSPLEYKDQQVGVALRTKQNIKPMFISPGHKISLADSVKIVLQCTTKYRMPEPTRKAHLLVNQLRRGEVTEGTSING